MDRERHRLAVALADAFLAGEWSTAGILASCSMVLEARHRWFRPLAAEVLTGYPRPPLDRPRELFRFVEQSAALAEVERRASRQRRPMPVPRHRITTATTMVRSRFPVAWVDDAAGLARLLDVSLPELLWFADTKGLLRRAGSSALQHYSSRWIRTDVGGVRLLEAPHRRLRDLQRLILEQILTPVPVHPAAHGFVRGRSVLTGARPHVAAQLVLSMDLESFFASITGSRVYGVFRAAGYPEPVAHLLTGLCTHATPVAVLSSMPPGADDVVAYRLRRRLAAPHLPQGAPSSPQLANLCAFPLDRRLVGYAAAVGAVYTRYADDLTFSGSYLAVRQRGIVAAVRRIATEEGFRLNAAKTRIRREESRQQVTGVLVNARTTVPREQYDLLRAILHNCLMHGPANQNRASVNDFRAHLQGRMAWVAHLDPERGRRLQLTFDRIDWNQSLAADRVPPGIDHT